MTMTMTTSTIKPRTTRKPKTKLSPAVAHELDMKRAARLGIDLSHLMPGERCTYPSRFCCNVRARKSTGKLHRFCEDHRSRANVNQKRWTQIRRRGENAADVINTSRVLCDHRSWMDARRLPLLVPTIAVASPSVSSTIFNQYDWKANAQPPSPTNVDVLRDDDLPLSEDEIDELTSIVAISERTLEAMTMEDAWLMTLLQDVESPVVTSTIFDELAISTL